MCICAHGIAQVVWFGVARKACKQIHNSIDACHRAPDFCSLVAKNSILRCMRADSHTPTPHTNNLSHACIFLR